MKSNNKKYKCNINFKIQRKIRPIKPAIRKNKLKILLLLNLLINLKKLDRVRVLRHMSV